MALVLDEVTVSEGNTLTPQKKNRSDSGMLRVLWEPQGEP